MAIENTYLLGKNITLGCGFDLQAKAPLDSRQTVPAFAGLQALIDGNAAYEGMIVYDEETKKTYQAQIVDDVLKFREFGINEAELKDLIASETTAAMEFKGAATALPENPAKGDMYKVTVEFEVEGETVKVGDAIVYNGEQWFIIPSGDDIEDTWRPVAGVDNDATLTFAAGDKLEKTVATDGTVTYKHVAIDAPTNMNEEGDEPTRTYITQLISDNHGHIIGFKTATENVEDTNTTYGFEGQSDEATSVHFQVKSSDADAAEVIYLNAYSKNEADAELDKKVDKSVYDAYIDGKAMSDAELKKYAEDYADGLADNYADAEHNHVVADITDFDAKVKEYGYATTGEVADAKSGAEAKAAELDDALKSELQDEIDADVKVVNDALEAYKTANDEAVNAKVAQTAYDADKATFATKTELGDVDAKFADYVTSASYAEDKADIDEAIADRYTKSEADGKFALITDAYNDEEVRGLISDNAEAIEAVEGYVGTFTHATAKTVVEYINAKTDGIATSGNLEALGTRVTAVEGDVATIKGDYLKAADIANFETKDNVKKVADDLSAYVELNDAALAAETKARTDADAGFETRIAALEGNFGDGEGTVEAQIAAAVKTEEDARKEAVKGVQDEVDAVEGRMDAAEGKITALETESAKHAIKTEVEGALALKADKSVVDAMYTNDQIDAAILVETNRAKGVEESLQTQINTIMSNPDAEGAINSINEFTQYVKDHGTIADGMRTDINKNKEDIATNAKAVSDETTRADAAEKVLAGRLDTLEAIDHEAYVGADASLKAELQKEIDDDVNAAIDAEILRANGAYDTKGAAADAQAAAIADAAGKYETKGTAQGIVDALKLGETYEPIGAETRAIAAAKTETENQVKALADTVYTKAEVESLLTWGSF